MFQWRSARRTSGEKEGTWQEKVPSSAGKGRGGGLHFICTPTHTSLIHFVNGVILCFTHTAPLLLGPYSCVQNHSHTLSPVAGVVQSVHVSKYNV